MLVFAQLFNCFNARSERGSAFRHVFANRWLWAAIGLSLVLQVAVVNAQLLNTAFGTVPLTFEQWLVCAALGSAVLWVSELRKLGWRLLAVCAARDAHPVVTARQPSSEPSSAGATARAGERR